MIRQIGNHREINAADADFANNNNNNDDVFVSINIIPISCIILFQYFA